MQRRSWMLATGAATLLAGCGFRLRGQVPLPYKSVLVEGRDTELVQMLKRALASETKVVGSAAQAEAVLRILSEHQERVSTVVDVNGLVSQVQLRLTVEVAMDAADGTVLIEATPLRTTQDMSYSDSQALAMQSEMDLRFQDMRRAMVSQIMRRMAFAHRTGR